MTALFVYSAGIDQAWTREVSSEGGWDGHRTITWTSAFFVPRIKHLGNLRDRKESRRSIMHLCWKRILAAFSSTSRPPVLCLQPSAGDIMCRMLIQQNQRGCGWVESETGGREDGMERDGYAQLVGTFVYQRNGRKLTVVPCRGVERILQPLGRLALPAVPMESHCVFNFIPHAMDRVLSFPRHNVHVGSWC